jgi:glucose-6-phosphate dehydrogenase assembly protein OpcA
MPPAAGVDPEKILGELHDLWSQLGSEHGGGVLRACSMTFIVAADSPEDAETVRKMTGALMHAHPNRAIVLCPCDGAELSARVFAECWMPMGTHQQICSEGIEITADPTEADDVARLLLPLIAPDLPVVLWCRGGRAFRDRAVDSLIPLGAKVMFDTGAARHAPSAIAFLRRVRQQGMHAGLRQSRRVADLAWTRLTPWREAVAHFFDDRPGKWQTITSARVVHGHALAVNGNSVPDSGAIYFSRWLERSMPLAGVSLELDLSAAPGLQSVTFAGQGEEIHIAVAGGACLEITSDGHTNRSALPPLDEQTLVRAELSILDGDPVYEKVLG